MLREMIVEELFARVPRNEYVEVAYASGARERLYVSDIVSGALLAVIVDRAKKLANHRCPTDGRLRPSASASSSMIPSRASPWRARQCSFRLTNLSSANALQTPPLAEYSAIRSSLLGVKT